MRSEELRPTVALKLFMLHRLHLCCFTQTIYGGFHTAAQRSVSDGPDWAGFSVVTRRSRLAPFSAGSCGWCSPCPPPPRASGGPRSQAAPRPSQGTVGAVGTAHKPMEEAVSEGTAGATALAETRAALFANGRAWRASRAPAEPIGAGHVEPAVPRACVCCCQRPVVGRQRGR